MVTECARKYSISLLFIHGCQFDYGKAKTEIAVLRSRGASRIQILLGYVLEGALLGGIALLVGPAIGMQLTKILGASNGFLEFVERAAMEVRLNREAYQYALVAVVASVCMTLIPAVMATRTTIVGHKQSLARKNKLSFVHKIFLDVILLAVSIYLLQSFNRRMTDLVALGLDSMDMKVDPLLLLYRLYSFLQWACSSCGSILGLFN